MTFNSCTLPVLPLTGIKLRSQKKSVKSGKKKTTNNKRAKKKTHLLLAMSFSFVCTYNVAFKSRSCSLWAPVVSWFWDSGYLCTVPFGYICSVLFRNIRICTLSCASHKQHSCIYQYKPRAFAEKPAFSSFSVWMNAVSLHEQGELASPHWAKSPEVLCTQSCLRLWWELHGYKTFRTSQDEWILFGAP